MRKSLEVLVVVLLSSLLVAGCTRQQQQAGDEPDDSVIEETGEAAEAAGEEVGEAAEAAGEEVGEAAGAVGEETVEIADETEDLVDDEVTVPLMADNNSGVSGQADLRSSGDSTRIEIELDGLEAGATYEAHLMSGACGSGIDHVAMLESFTPQEGSGGSTTAIPAGTLTPGTTYHIDVESGGSAVACGEFVPEL